MANAQLQTDFIDNGRGGYYLIQAGYKYSIKTRRDDRCYWRCVDRTCPATVTTVDNIPTIIRGNHNHPSDRIGLAASVFMNNMKKRARDEVNPIPSIYDEELGSLRDREFDDTVEDMIKKVPSFESMKSALYRSRAKIRPNLPKTQADINLGPEWEETKAGERFLLSDDTNDQGHRVMIFSTDDNLRNLCESDTIFADGTFYSCPGLFYQLYCLHGKVNDTVFPLVYAFLPNKTEVTYTRFWTHLKDALIQRNLVLSPRQILLDFEVAAKNALRTVFPLAIVKGCFFHFAQAVWRKTQECGLSVLYREDDNINRLVRRAAVLPLVPLQDVEDVWFNALTENENNSAEVTRFTDYVTVNYVETRSEFWNHYNNSGPRTTNHAEGFHSKLKRLVKKAHPNIYEMLEVIKNIQATNEAKIIQINAGAKQRLKKRKYRILDTRYQLLTARFETNNINVLQYADALSYLIHLIIFLTNELK